MHEEQTLEFIDRLVLPTVAKPRTRNAGLINTVPPIDPTKNSATVGPELMNIYLPGVSAQNREDVDNCKLLMQNAATQLFDPRTQLIEWYNYYTKGLEKLGWIIQSSNFKNIEIKRVGLTMDGVLLEVLKGLLGDRAGLLQQLSNKAVEHVKGNERLINVYNRNAKVGKETKFDISPVWQTAEGSPMMILNCTSVDVKESKRGILFWKSTTASTKVTSAAQATYLNTSFYNGIRASVIKKLNNAAEDFLEGIPGF